MAAPWSGVGTAGGASVAATVMPGRAFWMPSTITLSPALRPAWTTTCAPATAPSVMRLASTLSSPPTTSTKGPAWSIWTDACGTASICTGSPRSTLHVDELAVDQGAIGIGERGPHRDGIGALIDLDVEEVDLARVLVRGAVGQRHLDHRRAGRVVTSASILQELALADRKGDVDRVLADDGREHAAVGPDQVADAERGTADAAGDRRVDLGVAEIDLRPLERRLGLQDAGRGHLVGGASLVDLRLRNVLVLDQLFAALQLDRGVDAVRLGARELGLTLVDHRLVGRLLDHEQEVAGLRRRRPPRTAVAREIR